MLTREEITKLAEKYQARAERAYQNYQETGLSRHDRDRRNAEDMADMLQAAVNAAEEHEMLMNLKAEMIWWAGKADDALAENAQKEKLAGLLENVISIAVSACHYRKRERKAVTEE